MSRLNGNLSRRVSIALAAGLAALCLSSPHHGRAQSGDPQAPLIEADKSPTRVRPAAPAKAKTAPAIQLPVQGIPTMPELKPPADADVVDAPAKPGAKPRTGKPSAARGKAFKVQLASAKSAAAASRQAARLRQRLGPRVVGLDLTVERAPHGLYRVVSRPLAERHDARALCDAVAAQHGSCLVVATHSVAKRSAPAYALVAAQAPERGVPVRAQLASLRSYEGATREVERLTRRYGSVLDRNSLTISRIDQGDRGTFYRVLTTPLPDRNAATGLCQRIALQAGCVLVRDHHREARLSLPPAAGAGSA
jgi:cell division septation protein DedD